MQNVFNVPRYSQYRDVRNKRWKTKACGVVALAMMCEHYRPDARVSLPSLIRTASQKGGYVRHVGWKHGTLVACAARYGLRAKAYDLAKEPLAAGTKELKKLLRKGPVVISVWRDPERRAGGHLVTAVGFDARSLLVHDPLGRTNAAIRKRIPWSLFFSMWKRRMLAVEGVRRVAKRK